MKLRGTPRKTYTKAKVRELAEKRKNATAKVDGVSDSAYQQKLGILQAAGHLKITGFMGFSVDSKLIDTGIPQRDKTKVNEMIVKLVSTHQSTIGEAPHLTGYLESASSADGKPYKLKGWFNEDGTIRLELVK